MPYLHAQCAHMHWHGVARGIMHMHSPSTNEICADTTECTHASNIGV